MQRAVSAAGVLMVRAAAGKAVAMVSAAKAKAPKTRLQPPRSKV